MGAVCSSISELSNNEPLRRLSGTEPIDPMDPFWNQLLSFSFLTPMNSADSRLLEEATLVICKSFAINNCKTGNFNSLIRTFLVRSTELKASAQLEDNIFTWQTYNALFIIRCVCKYFVEHLSEELLLQQFDVKAHQPTDKTGSTPSEQHTGTSEELITSLVELLVDVPVVSCTYALHVEALNTLIVLLSIQMFQPQPAVRFSVYRFMMEGKCSIHACVFMKALLRNFIEQQKCPAELFKSSEESGLYRVTAAVASGLWSVLTLGFGGKQKKSEDEINDAILANQSLLFILILANHCTNEKGLHNPYREALFSFTNSQDQSNTLPTQAVATFKIDFSKLYTTICSMLKDDQTTLLLYLLVHRNSHMKAFILSRTNTDQLVLPILKILYHAPDRNSHHIYMALIILLVLSEDEFFSKSVHEITLQTIPWFKERVISEITLGGLLILVVIRTIQYNMTRMRDKYLHTNCLAALANMSAHFRNLHPYVAQRIVSLFAQLCKKHTRLIEQIRLSAVQDVTKKPRNTGFRRLNPGVSSFRGGHPNGARNYQLMPVLVTSSQPQSSVYASVSEGAVHTIQVSPNISGHSTEHRHSVDVFLL
ncbi:dymeclin-like [Liolophura sinensis]|uniref:dymeclin-like n=1 Tax=Liolophura sinensis TaxID=3198878 RepID=UPI003159155A